MSQITTDSARYLVPVIELLTCEPRISSGVKVLLPDGSQVGWDGSAWKVPRGFVQTDFRPRLGRLNLTTAVPSMPVTAPPEFVPVPARVGMSTRLVNGYAAAATVLQLAIDGYEQIAPSLEAFWNAQAGARHLEATLVAPNPNPEALRSRIKAKTMTKTKAGESWPRRKIHGFSRKGA
jgi:hypothetical protein